MSTTNVWSLIRYVVMYIIVIFLLDKQDDFYSTQWENSAT